MASPAKLGTAILTLDGKSLEVECGFKAAVRVDQMYGEDIAAYINRRILKQGLNGEVAISRMGMSEVFYLLQIGDQMSQEEIYEALSKDILSNEDPQAFVAGVMGVLDQVMGSKYQTLNSGPTVASTSSKKTPSSSMK